MSPFQASATLTGALLANKGGAVPSSILLAQLNGVPREAPQPRPEPEIRLASSAKPKPVSPNRVKLSLRLDRSQHLRLKLAAAHLFLSSQKILLTALDDYLSRAAPDIMGGNCACLVGTGETRR